MKLPNRMTNSRPQITQRRRACRMESLEARSLLAGNPILSEFMAANETGIVDADGDRSDWIEIRNDSSEPVNLEGWYLTDKADNLTKWRLPSRTLTAQQALIVFASEKDRTPGEGELHTNFQLSSSGEYLALVKPDGLTIANDFGEQYPQQFTDVSFGLRSAAATSPLLASGAAVKALAPTAGNGGSALGTTWTGGNEPFNDATWQSGTYGAGYLSGSSIVAPSNLVSRYDFTTNPGTAAGGVVDVAHNAGLGSTVNNSGTAANASWQASVAGSGVGADQTRTGVLTFDAAASSQVMIPTSAEHDATTGSISLWFKTAGNTGTGQEASMLLDHRTSSGEVITINNAGQIFVQAVSGPGVVANSYSSSAVVTDNRWHHLVYTYNVAAGGKTQLFLDGVLNREQTNVNAWSWPANVPVLLGTSWDPYWRRFNGSLDDLRIYNRVLTPAEIAAITTGDSAGSQSDVSLNLQASMQNLASSAYLRSTFNAPNAAALDQIALNIKYNDGFVAYVNGHEIARANTSASVAWNSTAPAQHGASAAETFVAGIPAGLLKTTGNVLAIHGLNFSASDSTFLISASLDGLDLVTSSVPQYFTTPTPGASNGSTAADRGPALWDVSATVNEMDVKTYSNGIPDSASVVVTAHASSTIAPLSNVTLRYRANFAAETALAMVDNGTNGDAVPGDGVYTAIIPAAASNVGQQLRWYVTAADTSGANARFPLAAKLTGVAQSELYQGTVIADATYSTQLNTYQLFVENNAAMDTDAGTRGSIFYRGELYDNVLISLRGGTTRNLTKKSHRLDFSDDHKFLYDDSLPRVDELALRAEYIDPAYVRYFLAAEVLATAGVPTPYNSPVRLQRNGVFYQLAMHTEQADLDFLSRLGYDRDGNLYQDPILLAKNPMPAYGNRLWSEARWLNPENDPVCSSVACSDLAALVDGVYEGRPLDARADYVFDHFDVSELINYLAAIMLVAEQDHWHANNFYYQNPDTDQWMMLPWDVNFTFGQGFAVANVIDNENAQGAHPFAGAQGYTASGLNGTEFHRLMDVVYRDPTFREMYLRRYRTLMDQFLQPSSTPSGERYFEQRIAELRTMLKPEADMDRALYGWDASINRLGNLSFDQGLDQIINEFLPNRRTYLYETQSVDNVPTPITTLIGEFATGVKYLVPTNDSLGTTWTQTTFNAAAWSTGQTGIGYQNQTGVTTCPINPTGDYSSYLKTCVKPQLANASASTIMTRIPFTVADPANTSTVTLRMKYDDGFVAYINGVEIKRNNLSQPIGTPLSWTSFGNDHGNGLASAYEDFVINLSALPGGNPLVAGPGANVLSLHVANVSLTSSDMLVLPQLVVGVPPSSIPIAGIPNAQSGNPAIAFGEIEFSPVGGNQDQEFIELVNPGNVAVDISGWQLSGGVDYTFAGGTVIPASGSLYLTPDVIAFRARTVGPAGGQGLFVVGNYSGHLSSFGETLMLTSRDGETVTTIDTPSNPSDPQQFLRITEIMYHPADPTPAEIAAGYTDADQFEFIELQNTSATATLNLLGMQFSNGVNLTLPFYELSPGERVVIASNADAFIERYGSDIEPIGVYTGNLSNGGENLRLDDAEGGTIHDFDYDDAWYPETDGPGYSLQIIDAGAPLDTWDLSTSWQASATVGGSPGTPGDSPLLPGDINGDNQVNLHDLAILQANLGIAVGATRAIGDLNGDGAVDRMDAVVLVQNYGRAASAPSAPASIVVAARARRPEASTTSAERIARPVSRRSPERSPTDAPAATAESAPGETLTALRLRQAVATDAALANQGMRGIRR